MWNYTPCNQIIQKQLRINQQKKRKDRIHSMKSFIKLQNYKIQTCLTNNLKQKQKKFEQEEQKKKLNKNLINKMKQIYMRNPQYSLDKNNSQISLGKSMNQSQLIRNKQIIKQNKRLSKKLITMNSQYKCHHTDLINSNLRDSRLKTTQNFNNKLELSDQLSVIKQRRKKSKQKKNKLNPISIRNILLSQGKQIIFITQQ